MGSDLTEPRLLIPLDISPDDLRGAHSDAALSCLHGHTMGTHYTLTYQDDPSHRSLPSIEAALQRAFTRVIAQMSHYDPTSELSRVNRCPAGEPRSLSDDFFHVLSAALTLSKETGGAYNPNLGALSAAYGFGPQPDLAVAPSGGSEPWLHLALDPVGRLLTHDLDRLHLDLSSIAKGYALDLAGKYLNDLGLNDFLLEIGGEFLARGCKPNAQPWWVDLESHPHLPRLRFALTRHALATSGPGDLSENSIHHLMDPFEVSPTRHELISVSVLARDCMTADALATALYVLGPVAGLAFAERRQIAAVFTDARGHRYSSAMEAFA